MELKADPHMCEEASPQSHTFYIPCNQPAVSMIGFRGGEGPYRMCAACADHNTRNRGAQHLGAYDRNAIMGPT